jgi:hypothetical protein
MNANKAWALKTFTCELGLVTEMLLGLLANDNANTLK